MPSKYILADDPRALSKLDEKIAELRKEYNFRRSVNRYRRKKSHSVEIQAKRMGVGIGISRDRALKLAKKGFDPKETRSIVTRIRQLEKRREQIKASQRAKPVRTEVVPGIVYVEDPIELRLGFEVSIPLPANAVRSLRNRGFRFAPTKARWQRKCSPASRAAARAMKVSLKQIMEDL